jgi:ABC-type antimicrobial peptide transport system permease subunit
LNLVGAFAVIALVLASASLYGVMAHGVHQRVPVIGLRLALGASRDDVVRLILGRGMTLAVAGSALGTLARTTCRD